MLAFAFVSMQAHQRRTMHATKAMAGEALSPQPVRTNTNTSVRDCAPRARAHCGPSLSLAGGRWRLRARAPPIHCAPAPPKCNTARKCLGSHLQASLYFAAAERNDRQSARLHRERRAQEAAQRLQEVEAAAAAARLRHAAREQERRAQQAAHRQQQVEDAAVAARQCDAARRRRERRVAMLQQRDQLRREEQQRRAERVQDRARERYRRYGALLWRTPLSCAWQCFVNTKWIHAAEAT